MDAVAARIHRAGPISVAEFMELALYGEGGFYSSGAGPGRRGADFLTSPEVGPLFGAVLANALDTWWDELGAPDPFVVAEAGAGRGVLAAAVLRAGPRCSPAMRYVIAERSEAARAAASDVLPVAPASVALAGEGHGRGPVVCALDDLPAGPFVGVVVANELLDNLPTRLLEKSGDGWAEVFVTLDDTDGGFVEVLVPAEEEAAGRAAQLAPDATAGQRIALHDAALAWLGRARRSLEAGRVVAFDYGVSATSELAARPWTDWFRTYRHHQRGEHPFQAVGEQDVTCEIAFDQLAPHSLVRQDDWLRAHGIDALSTEARADLGRTRRHRRPGGAGGPQSSERGDGAARRRRPRCVPRGRVGKHLTPG